jgi:glucosamine--fructose-6-phosphate aminotransferase (isomerizing)
MALNHVQPQSHMFREAASAPDVVRRQLGSDHLREAAERLRALDPPLVLTCARGSSDQAATYLQYLLPALLGIGCYSQPPSLGSLLGRAPRSLEGAVMLLISQSGRSPDLLRSAEAARRAGMTIVGCVNDETSPLAEMVDILLPVGAGPERSVAATKSYLATLSALAMLAARWKGDSGLAAAIQGLPSHLEDAWNSDWSEAIAPIANSEHLFVLGRDLTLGAAGETALKLKETASLHAEAFSLAEVAHGPMTLVGPKVPVLAFPTRGSVEAGALELLKDFAARGACTMTVGYPALGGIELPLAQVHDVLLPIVVVQGFYRLCEEIAHVRGCDPDGPPALKKVTQT